MNRVGHYSSLLLVAGIVLIVGSCVPLAQTLWTDTDAAPLRSLELPHAGGASLTLEHPLSTVPVALIESYPRVADIGTDPLYVLTITGPSGEELLREDNIAVREPANDDTRAAMTLRFPEVDIPAGRWTVRLIPVRDGDPHRGAEIRFMAVSAGFISPLLTALVLGILGWLTATLGALQWIRSEAARAGMEEFPDPDVERERLWVLGCHVSALLGYVLPFGHVVGPLAIWLTKRNVFPGVERAGREVLNFQLSVTLYILAALFLSFFLIGVLILFLVVVFHFSMVLYASLRAQRGLDVRYPLVIKVI